MRAGKHVYCQKPMAHDVFEVRQMELVARQAGVVTQLGTQHASGIGDRMGVQMVRDGAIGKIKEVYMWSNRPGHEGYRRKDPRPAKSDAVPKHLNWDLWLGTAPTRPYVNGIYHPVRWRTVRSDHPCFFPAAAGSSSFPERPTKSGRRCRVRSAA